MKKGFLIARRISIVLLILSIGPMPHDYYTLLRFVVCCVAFYGAYLAFKGDKSQWAWSFTVTAVLFNPIAPVNLSYITWAGIDIVTAGFFFLSCLLFTPKDSHAWLTKYHLKRQAIAPSKAKKIVVSCPECEKKIRIPATKRLYKITCPRCGCEYDSLKAQGDIDSYFENRFNSLKKMTVTSLIIIIIIGALFAVSLQYEIRNPHKRHSGAGVSLD